MGNFRSWNIHLGCFKEKDGEKRGKAPVVEVIYAQPLNAQVPLRISEPSKGVTLANPPTAQAIFKGRGEVVLVFDKEAEEH